MVYAPPMFADADLHLQPWSPAVDAAMPWHTDAHMPYGLGGLRADMGAYGGPGNAGWGGQAAPSGAAVLTAVMDSPQDQGGQVGLTFGGSAFDEAWVPENVTHYAVWRHFDPSGTAIADVEDGNWELLGTMPSLGLNGYAYQAATLGNTNAYGDFASCFFVAAHTADPGTYWVSNVVCGESVDDLAPQTPVVNGMLLAGVGAQLQWLTPAEADYAYTEVVSNQGFAATLGADTTLVDATVAPGMQVMYTVRHFDVNGNGSVPATFALDTAPGVDVIPLVAGWNLISTDREPAQGNVVDVFAGLLPGNLEYVTGFEGGVAFYDPNGLAFLNSLGSIDGGAGYWVKVAQADTLEVVGDAIGAGYAPTLGAGWNLVGYVPQLPAAPGLHFADLVATGNLQYVTGFDGGAQYYDPNGLPFLNSLQQLRNGFGYWVKVAQPVDPNGFAAGGNRNVGVTPDFMVVNGQSDLGAFAGESVDVVDGTGNVVATLPILEGGYLMTTGLFGDDATTPEVEGIERGADLRFRFQGAWAEEGLAFTGGQTVQKLSLHFPALSADLAIFPNPTEGLAQVRLALPVAGAVESVLRDAAGREVLRVQHGDAAAGVWTGTVDASALPAGTYRLTVVCGGMPHAAVPFVKTR